MVFKDRPAVEGTCKVVNSVLSCRTTVAKRPVEFEEMGDGSVRIVREEALRSWPMSDVESIVWLEGAPA